MQFYIVDVFAEEKYTGNQLAVIRGAERLSDQEMQHLAQEMNYSETTFILGDTPRDGGYDVRIFTPAREIPFAGHPTLGTAYIIRQELIGQPVEQVNLNLAVGQIPVTIGYANGAPDILWMRQNPPDFGSVFDPATVAAMLNIPVEEIDTRFPIQDVSTGLPFIITPLRSRAAIQQCQVNVAQYFQLVEESRAKAFLVFCAEPYQPENQLNVRVFTHYYNIPEDPATGSGNGGLAAYLVKHRYFGAVEIDIRAEQGYEINRPSLLYLRAKAGDEGIAVSVGGRVVMIARGSLV
jgi:trans-2,3-dihydro-3-hydroxyanthranilate isomerase